MDLVAGVLFFGFVFFPRRDAYGMGVLKGTIENSNGVWRGDIQEQRVTLEACG